MDCEILVFGSQYQPVLGFGPTTLCSHHGLFGVDLLRGGVGDLLDDGGDVGGAVELQLGEAGLVGLHHALNT